jgi:hypothetical protein
MFEGADAAPSRRLGSRPGDGFVIEIAGLPKDTCQMLRTAEPPVETGRASIHAPQAAPRDARAPASPQTPGAESERPVGPAALRLPLALGQAVARWVHDTLAGVAERIEEARYARDVARMKVRFDWRPKEPRDY